MLKSASPRVTLRSSGRWNSTQPFITVLAAFKKEDKGKEKLSELQTGVPLCSAN